MMRTFFNGAGLYFGPWMMFDRLSSNDVDLKSGFFVSDKVKRAASRWSFKLDDISHVRRGFRLGTPMPRVNLRYGIQSIGDGSSGSTRRR